MKQTTLSSINLLSKTFQKSFALVIITLLLLTIGATLLLPSNAGAVSGSDFKPGRIIDDSVFYNEFSMDTNSVQSFLNAKVPSCDTNGSQPAADKGRPDITRAQYAALQGWHGPPYTCLRDYKQNTPQLEAASGLCEAISAKNGRSAAGIIADVARACHINPQVLIILLQKEQSLILDTWPLKSQYRDATGFGCPDTAPCDPSYEGFFYQVYHAARQFQVYKKFPFSYNYIAGRNNTVYYHPGPYNNAAGQWYGAYGTRRDIAYCGSSQVYIENQATAALYIYTPYQPNSSALNNLYGTGDICGSYGNRNFWRLFNDWFGSTLGNSLNGLNYSVVFNAEYYLNKYPDVRAEYGTNQVYAFMHFVEYGMKEGRQGSAEFDLTSYRNRHQDLRLKFGTDFAAYYIHYITNGKAEGRISSGAYAIQYITKLNGLDYANVYNFSSYINTYPDMRSAFRNDDAGAIKHFVNYGMQEGRQGSVEFNANAYRAFYYDIRHALGDPLKSYYLHYITNGKAEGRTGKNNTLRGIDSLNGINYSSIYSFGSYSSYNSDIKTVYKLDDRAALSHFVNYGMQEGRRSSDEFNLSIYKNRYIDLQQAFGNNSKSYYLHYLTNGKKEGRTAI